jgi:drug/metabolite transporter (DMT)-like permease
MRISCLNGPPIITHPYQFQKNLTNNLLQKSEKILYRLVMELQRIIPLLTALLGVLLASIRSGTTDSLVIETGAVVAGVATFGGGVAWYRRQREQADKVRIDERIEHFAYRSDELACRVSLAFGMILFLIVEAESVPVTAKEGLVILILGTVGTRFGLYEWSKRHSV